MNKIFHFFFIGMTGITISSCQNRGKTPASTSIDTAAMTDTLSATGNTEQANAISAIQTRYAGTVPCADCEGIKMILTLLNETYSLEETYLGKSDQALQSKGPMLIERGYEKDNDATLYILNPDSDTEKRYFVRLTAQPGKLIMLDKDQKIITSKFNYTLSEEK